MSILTMNMSGYEIERDEIEVGTTDWLPELALYTAIETNRGLPPEMIAVDPDSFLERMYTYQR